MINRDVLLFRVSKSVSKGRHKEQLCSSDTAMRQFYFTGKPLSFDLLHEKSPSEDVLYSFTTETKKLLLQADHCVCSSALEDVAMAELTTPNPV